MKPITVLIVDDSALMRDMLTKMLDGEPDIQVIGTAEDAYDAREKIKQLNPDVLTLDIEMPHMDGLAFLEKIMTLRPMPVIMVSTLTQAGAQATIRALELGAFDYLEKPSDMSDIARVIAIQERLKEMVRAAANAHVHVPLSSPKRERPIYYKTQRDGLPVVAIGASTGGVESLRYILSRMPTICPPIVIAQHMPAAFTKSFAARLNELSLMTVVEAVNGARLQNGYAFVAPGGKHLTVMRRNGHLICKVEDAPDSRGHRPSVDTLLHSVAQVAGADSVGAVLTGMGKDGAEGLLAMRKAGAFTIAQDEQSSVVYGMPRAAMQLNAAEVQLPLTDIARTIITACQEKERYGSSSNI